MSCTFPLCRQTAIARCLLCDDLVCADHAGKAFHPVTRPLEAGASPSPARPGKRNRRSVWTITSQPFAGAHFATFPEALVEPCILAGSRPGDLVLDPFAGSGTVGVVALRHGRNFIGLELNAEYVELARRRIAGPLFAETTT